jgi:branched-chain amino acid transport system substrate-binding protein
MENGMRIGVLLPAARFYPQFAQSWLNGLRLGCGRPGDRPVEWVTVAIDARPESAARATRQLTVSDHVDLVVGLINPRVAGRLRHLVEASRTVLIAADAGGQLVAPSDGSLYVFHSTLGLWQATWALGGWAARNLGRRAMVAVSFYEAGFDLSGAFWLGFETAGGQVDHLHITHVPPDTGDPAPLLEMVGQVRPDCVCALYSSLAALRIVRAYHESEWAGRIPLLGSAFLVEEDILPLAGEAAEGVWSGLSWAGGLDTSENRALAADVRAQTDPDRDASGQTGLPLLDAPAVLGYDTGRLIGAAFAGERPEDWIGALERVEFTGPRGRLKMDARTHSLTSPLYLRQVQLQDGRPVNRVVAELEAVGELDERLQPIWSELRTGWLDTYLL